MEFLYDEYVRLQNECDQLWKERNEAIRQRDNLLACIHRDGGHYVAQHGVDKACDDAYEIIARLNVMKDKIMKLFHV